MISIFEAGADSFKVNQHTKYLRQMTFSLKVTLVTLHTLLYHDYSSGW